MPEKGENGRTRRASAKATATARGSTARFSAEERAAMKEHAEELRKTARRSRGEQLDGEGDVLAKIAEMPVGDREIAERLHALIKATAPDLSPRTWYGMPAYARDGSLICYFQGAFKWKTRYATFAFTDKANLDDGEMWPTSYALKVLTAAEEAKVVALLKRALG